MRRLGGSESLPGGGMRSFEFSPQAYARAAGFLYVIVIVGGVFAEIFVRQRLIVTGDPAATADNILSHARLFRFGFVAELVPLLCNVLLAVIFYELLKIVSRRAALLVVFFTLVGTAIEGATLIGHLAPLIILVSGHAPALGPVMQAQALAALELQSLGFAIALTFFGGYCITIGYLVFRSTFFPRIIGVLLAIEGLCYLANSFTDFLAPALAGRVFVFLLVAGIAEVVFCLWLLFRGLNAERWWEQANMASRMVARL